MVSLVEFSFSNYRSFKVLQWLAMEAAPIKSKYVALDEQHVFDAGRVGKLLKSKAVYGANASGKSNVAKALSAFAFLINESVRNEEAAALIWDDRHKRSADCDGEPMFFQLMFLVDRLPCRYGFELLDGIIRAEWLFATPNKKEVPLFTRLGEAVDVNSAQFKEAQKFVQMAKRGEGDIFRPNSLFLPAVSLMGGRLAHKIVDSITDILIIDGVGDKNLRTIAMKEVQNQKHKADLLRLLRSADFDIGDLDLVQMPDEIFDKLPAPVRKLVEDRDAGRPLGLVSVRDKYGEDGSVVDSIVGDFADWESEGTQKFLDVGAMLLVALREGRPIIIDEFDARLHPRLSKAIVDLFHDPDANPNNAQLIFITHDTGLLKPDKLRRDQIAFVSKDRRGASTIKTLVEYKGVRNDASYDKEYLSGAFGAVPHVSRLGTAVAIALEQEGEEEITEQEASPQL